MEKPLGIKSYGSIPHLPGSRLGAGDHRCEEGQYIIATKKVRDRHDDIIVQEKLDGSNVSVALIDGIIYPLSRSGYLASTSPYEQHWQFSNWAYENQSRFLAVLKDGERLCGEWLMQAHGTRYNLNHEPFVAFDLMYKHCRMIFDEFINRVSKGDFITPKVIHRGLPLRDEDAMHLLNTYGFHGALDPVEGAVWRVERNKIIRNNSNERKKVSDFLVKYVRPDKVDGQYLPEISGNKAIFNWYPKKS